MLWRLHVRHKATFFGSERTAPRCGLSKLRPDQCHRLDWKYFKNRSNFKSISSRIKCHGRMFNISKLNRPGIQNWQLLPQLSEAKARYCTVRTFSYLFGRAVIGHSLPSNFVHRYPYLTARSGVQDVASVIGQISLGYKYSKGSPLRSSRYLHDMLAR